MERDETFSVTENVLIRSVVPARGSPYQHTCDLDVYESVAHSIDELTGASFTLQEIRKRTGAPFTQVAVAIAFLKELRRWRLKTIVIDDGHVHLVHTLTIDVPLRHLARHAPAEPLAEFEVRQLVAPEGG